MMSENLPNAQLEKFIEEATYIQSNETTIGGRAITHAEQMAAYTIEDLAERLIEERSRPRENELDLLRLVLRMTAWMERENLYQDIPEDLVRDIRKQTNHVV